MDTTLYLLAKAGFILTTFIFYGLFLSALKKVLLKTIISKGQQRKILIKTIVAIVGWAIIISVLSLAGITSDFSTFPPKFGVIGIVPLVALSFVLLFSKTTKTILDHTSPQTLLNLQVFRIPVEVLLWLLFIANVIPEQMTFEGRNFDILAGITGPIVAYFGMVKNKWPKTILIAWNIICLGLLINIVGTAMLSLPTPFRYFMSDPASTAVTTFPIIWLPGLLVPLAYGLHFLSLRQLLSKSS